MEHYVLLTQDGSYLQSLPNYLLDERHLYQSNTIVYNMFIDMALVLTNSDLNYIYDELKRRNINRSIFKKIKVTDSVLVEYPIPYIAYCDNVIDRIDIISGMRNSDMIYVYDGDSSSHHIKMRFKSTEPYFANIMKLTKLPDIYNILY